MVDGSMKNHGFWRRVYFAWSGIAAATSGEASFRSQLGAGVAIFAFLAWSRPSAVWWALTAATVSAILAAELFNTALEHLVDVLHPDLHPMIGRAKDCAAGAVLVLSIGALGVFGALVYQILHGA